MLDVDGTLLTPAGVISRRVRTAVREASERGCLVTLASGRRLWAVRPIAESLGIGLPVILYNGAIVYDVEQDTPLIAFPLEADPLRQAIDLIWQRGFQPVVYGHPNAGEPVFTGPVDRDSEATAHYFNRPTTQPTRLERDGFHALQSPLLLAAMGREQEMRALAQDIGTLNIACQTLVERQSFVPQSQWWQIDVSAPDCSKGNALRQLCELTGISIAETLAVGDGINDLELIQSAGFGVAMGNAVAAVKDAADAIVADNLGDGAAEALERFVLA